MLVGRHIDSPNTLSSLQLAIKLKCEVLQIFVSPMTVTDIRTFVKKKKMLLFIHSDYSINLARPIETSKTSLLIKEMRIADQLKAEGVIVHMGHGTTDNYMRNISYVLEKTTGIIILENGAGTGMEINTSLYDLLELYRIINNMYPNRVKICIDTCHAWASGHTMVDVYRFCAAVGWDNIACFHLNDSKGTFGSRIDRHADIGFGTIQGLENLLQSIPNIPLILETPCDTYYRIAGKLTQIDPMDQMELIRSWLHNI